LAEALRKRPVDVLAHQFACGIAARSKRGNRGLLALHIAADPARAQGIAEPDREVALPAFVADATDRAAFGPPQEFLLGPAPQLEQARITKLMFMVLMGMIAAISLVVGGIGIMNIMLVSVTERTREIGIRMAVGARGNDILLQFLTEAVTLSIIGGLIGIGIGVAASKGIEAWKNWPVATPMLWILASFIVSAAVGIFFGFYPARKASRLDPIDALRYE